MRASGNTFKLIGLAAALVALAGCFDNLSALSSGTISSSQKNGSTLNDSGFANETGPINTNASIIGIYNDAAGSANGYGILVDLNASLVATLGQDSVTAIVTGIDTNTVMQSRSITIHFPAFGMKAVTTLGALAAGNNGKLRNIMNIRPRYVRVDLTTSALQIPSSPTVIQLNNSNKTVITYGGTIEGDYIRRMTVLIPFAGVNAGFLPGAAVPTYGDGYPTASPVEQAGSVKLISLSGANGLALVNHFAKILTNAPYGTAVSQLVPTSIQTINQNFNSLALAVHLGMNTDGTTPICPAPPGSPAVATDPTMVPFSGCNKDGTRRIDAAFLININPANNSGPETAALCNSGFDNQLQTQPYGNIGSTVDYSHPLACNCANGPGGSAPNNTIPTACVAISNPNMGETTPSPLGSQLIDPWPTTTSAQWPTQIMTAINSAIAPPTTALPPASPITVNGFVISADK